MIVAFAIVVALACITASALRLWYATNPTALEPRDIIVALQKGAKASDLESAVREEPAADWERDLLAAITVPREEVRIALVNEQLTELDLRLQRWARVPRVCASVATSVGIMLGTLVMRRGLAETGEISEDFVRGILSQAISVVSIGLIATAFCIGAHAHARRLTRARLEATDQMIEKLEAAVAGGISYRN